jgi:chromosome segregation ATPase
MTTDADDKAEITQQIKEIEVRLSESTDEHISARQTVDGLLEQVKSEFEGEDVPDEIRDTIQQTYQDSAQETVRQYRDLDDSISPEVYCKAIDDLSETLESILNEPHARKLINDLSSWLTSESASPLNETERDTLVENIKDDVSEATNHVADLKENWKQLRDEIPDPEPPLELIRAQILTVESPGDIRSLALDVKNTATDLTYPITFKNDGPFSSDIESRINQLIQSELASWIGECETFADFDRKVTGDWDTLEESVENIESSVDDILELVSDISSVGIERSRVTDAIDRFADPKDPTTETPDSLRAQVDAIQAALETIRKMTRKDVSRYQASEQEIPDRIEEQVETIVAEGEKARDSLEAALDAADPSTISEQKESFDDAIGDAEEELEALSDELGERVRTIEQLADEFDAAEQAGRARELRDEIPSMDLLDDYVAGFRRYEEIRTDILDEARGDLEGDEDQLFELILDRGGKLTIGAGDFEKLNSKLEWEEDRIGTALMGLNQKGFINLDARAF